MKFKNIYVSAIIYRQYHQLTLVNRVFPIPLLPKSPEARACLVLAQASQLRAISPCLLDQQPLRNIPSPIIQPPLPSVCVKPLH